jgi:hypothetical protein
MKYILDLTVEDLVNAYKGAANRCACGCSGTYYDADRERMEYILKRVQRRYRRHLNGNAPELEVFEYTDGGVMWAYRTQAHLWRIETKPGV